MTALPPTCPFSITLEHADHAEIVCREILRDLPLKRCVLRGEWNQRQVLVKLFLHPVSAHRHWQREKQGVQKLIDADLTTPALLFCGQLTDQTPVLVFEFIPKTQSALHAWQHCTSETERLTLLNSLVTEIARQHAHGIWQEDLHLGNFLIAEKTIYTIDGDAIAGNRDKTALNPEQSADNLALFQAQIAPHFDPLFSCVVQHYMELRKFSAQWQQQLNNRVISQRQKRRLKYVAKSFRSCSEFLRSRHNNLEMVQRRDVPADFIDQFKTNPDQIVASSIPLKDGNSATVVRLTTPDGDWVVKRYNIKNLWHGLKRCLRRTRASVSWGNAHRLKISGISTPSAIAMAEKRFGPLRLTGYYVCDFVEGKDVAAYFADGNEPNESQLDTANRLIELFRIFLQLGIVHGDCKATNFLVTDQGIAVIDLDAMWEPKSRKRFNKLYRRDRSRFLRNWKTDCALYRWFDRHLPQPDDI
ncbi:lipopolysaccharide kinase InaA family protein [uncultured Desulfuromonas sp.]|uniref:lipopolysaccharide kinase InaA family protein n=1 Tax=uncultured Desulfuromonas sp. TaxID=181013 RepID=UPI002AAA6908|nr:lipopolysaccharide kinase InaA family protein [uncultured Desulfuromonas sp.]